MMDLEMPNITNVSDPSQIYQSGKRRDGRVANQIRQIESEQGLLLFFNYC